MELRSGAREFLGREQGLLIGGSRVASESGRTFETLDPATGEVPARVAQGSGVDAARAVVSARGAFEGPWSRLSPADRSLVMLRTAGSRLYAPADRFDGVVGGLEAAAKSVVMGSGLSSETFLGPLVSARQRDRVLGYVEAGVAEGAELVAGGAARGGEGFFVEPTLFTAVSDELEIVREEIFGPVLVVLPYSSVDEAIERANGTEYGLAAGVSRRTTSSRTSSRRGFGQG